VNKIVVLLIGIFGFLSLGVSANSNEVRARWQKPVPIFDQKFDWLRLTSDEWLKGDIISMYDDELEFDSEEFDRIIFDWEDVAELRSRFDQRIRLSDGSILKGFLIVKGARVTILSDGKPYDFPLSDLLSITSSGEMRRNLWDSRISLGMNFLAGNIGQKDLNSTIKVERRTPETRFNTSLLINYSEVSDKEDKTRVVKADSQRVNSYLDWFYTADIFIRLIDYEYFSDSLQNINSRNTIGAAFGYHIIDNKRIVWDITAGPSYQKTSFDNTVSNESEDSAVISLGTLVEYEISSRIDYVIGYQVQFVNDTLGKRIHNLKTGFSFDLKHNFDLDFNLYIDRIASPFIDANGEIPEPNDYRLVVGFAYSF
jgi:putative salt-induced outer membrane protein YdiY